jgi:hypothetical protein
VGMEAVQFSDAASLRRDLARLGLVEAS